MNEYGTNVNGQLPIEKYSRSRYSTVKNPGSENPASESRRLAYLAAPWRGHFAAAYNNDVIRHKGTKAQSLKNSRQNHMVTLCVLKNIYTALFYGHFVPLCLCAFY